ncbi:AT-hook motif nuclear-localized protein 1-like isoform X2 [Triticum dicoccoides]|uniref:AT-hook motif nuclear-localized protein 1-like isoform X2 n=1 Tax=Triticum dicoccoides TaxID=85692 RepID=UPI0018913039|nr:AT-hook motif nuclear-localized protein 1-like isoform X2 [Triticum dicoccoides]
MEAKPGEASSPTATAAAAAPVAAAAVPEATVSFQSPASVPPPAASHAPVPSPVEMVSSSGLFVPPGMMTAMVAAAGRGALSAGPLVKVGKKRGRPRKYGPDGSLIQPLNATPISASAPMSAAVAAGQYTPAAAVGAAMKRGRGRPLDFAAAAAKPYHHQLQQPAQQQFGFHFSSIGDMVACSAGGNFTPHIITVAPGEDVTMKVISFSQQGPRAICILSANGVISNVTLRQPDSSGGTLTYEGRFELLSLSGSFMPTENSGTRSRSGGMSVSLASPDGRVVGGGVAGLLIVVGSFLPSYPMEPKQKKARVVAAPTLSQAPPAVQLSSADTHSSEQGHHSLAAPRMNVVTSSAYSADQNWASTVVQSAPAEASRSASSGDLNLTASGS